MTVAPGERKWAGGTLVIASNNPDKVAELRIFLGRIVDQLETVDSFTDEIPEETGETFGENARIKALAAARASNLPALGDDSGLAVTALDNAPGVFSARWAGPDRDFHVAIKRIEKMLAGKIDRSAVFVCALALVWPDGTTRTVEGQIKGTLTFPPRGNRGFGYDPIFIPNGWDETFGEVEPARKDKVSHRAEAFNKLVQECFET